jgi:hypothetical protein
MEHKESQLEGKMIEVFLSTTRNVAALSDIKILFMDFMGKFEEGVTTASPSEPESILEQQQAPINVDLLLVKPMHNGKRGTCLHLGYVARPTKDLKAHSGGESRLTRSKGKMQGSSKDGSGSSKSPQTSEGKKKGLVKGDNVHSPDTISLWNELVKSKVNSLAKATIEVGQITGRSEKSQAKRTIMWGKLVQKMEIR